MPSPEVTPSSPPAESRPSRTDYQPSGQSEPLWWRILYQEHMVALVRMFGHRELPIEEARGKVKGLVERYGKETIIAASDEIVEQDGQGEVQIARLTERARSLAVQLIGRVPEATGTVPTVTATPNCSTIGSSLGNISPGSATAISSATSEPVASPSTHTGERQETEPLDERHDSEMEDEADLRDDEPCESVSAEPCACFNDRREQERQAAFRDAPHETPGEDVASTEPPARLSRQEVLVLFVESLESHEFSFEPFSEFAERELVGSQLPVLDFVVHGDDETIRFVTVCPGLTGFQRRDIHDTFRRQVMDESDLLFRVWPHAGPNGWTWFWYPIEQNSADRSDSKVAEPMPVPAERDQCPQASNVQATFDASRTTPPTELAASPAAEASDGHSGKSCDLKHVSHRLDLLAEDLEAITEKHRKDSDVLQSLRDEFEAIRWQVEQATKAVAQPATTEASVPAASTPSPLQMDDTQREKPARPSQKKAKKRRNREPQQS